MNRNNHIINPERVPKGHTAVDVVLSQYFIKNALPDFPMLEKIPCPDFEHNRKHWIKNQLRKAKPESQHLSFAKRCLAVHSTTLTAALEIIKSGNIKSYRQIAQSDKRVEDSGMLLRTDELDMQLGLDRNVFLSLGRVNPIETENVYFCFPNSVLDQPECTIALREIVHFDALVSRAAILAHQEHGLIKPNQAAQINQKAANGFYANLFSSNDFLNEIFPRFLALAKEYRQGNLELSYSTLLEYPGKTPKIVKLGNEITINGAWDGPQAMIPDSVSIDQHLPAILIGDTNEGSYQQIVASGYPKDRIFSISEVIQPYFTWSKGKIQRYDMPLIPYRYLNLALRDISLLAAFNREAKDYPEKMIAFKDRITKT